MNAPDNLDAWLETDDHVYECVAYNEGLDCCLNKDHPSRKFLDALIAREREQAKRELLDDLVSYANFVDRGENPEDHAPFDLGSLHIYRINFRHPLTPNEPKEAE